MEVNEITAVIKKEGKWSGNNVPLYAVRFNDGQPVGDDNHSARLTHQEDIGFTLLKDDVRYEMVEEKDLSGKSITEVKLAYETGTDSPRVFVARKFDEDIWGTEVQTNLGEAREIAGLSHPYIERVFELVSDADGNLYTIYEFLEGPNILEKKRKNIQLRPVDAHKFVFQMCSAVAYVHNKGLIHNDLKPENFIFTKPLNSSPEETEVTDPAMQSQNEDVDLKLTDFTIARRIDAPVKKPKHGTAVVSPYDDSEADWGEKSDVYSLAVSISEVMFEDISFENTLPLDKIFGKAKFNEYFLKLANKKKGFLGRGEDPLDKIRQVLTKAVKKSKQRYASVKEFYKDLNQAFLDLGLPNDYPNLLD